VTTKCVLYMCVAFYTLQSEVYGEVELNMISVLKKVEKVNNEYLDLEVTKAEALAYWQTHMRKAK